MKKTSWTISLFAVAAFFLFAIGLSAADPHPSGKPVQGTLKISTPDVSTAADGEKYWIQVGGAPLNSQVRFWVDNGDGKGFQDFGILGTTTSSTAWLPASGKINLQKTLNCSSYEYLEPGKSLSVGNRDLFVKFYAEFVGKNTVSNVAWMVVDCSQTGDPVSTGNVNFPYTLESIYGRNNILKPFPDSYPSGIPASFKFAGRYFDGKDRGGINMGLGFEWYHPYGSATNVGGNNNAKVIGNKIYIPLGSTIAGYNKDTFISRLANSGNSSLAVFAGTREKNGHPLNLQYDLAILPWDAYVYPEHKDNAWLREFCDCHTGITWSTVDDRGYSYFNDRFGFGIADPSLRIIVQIRGIEGLTFGDGQTHTLPWLRSGRNGIIKLTDLDGLGKPDYGDGSHVTIIKTGSKYYAVFTGNGTIVLDVTEPNNPKYERSAPDEWISTLVQSGETVAVAAGTSHLGFAPTNSEIKIYNAADFIAGTTPKKVFSAGAGGYAGLTADKTTGRFYSAFYSSAPRPKSSIPAYILPTASIAVFTPSGNSYTEQRHVLSAETMGGRSGNPGWNGYQYIYSVKGLDYQNGYLVARGQSPEGMGDVKIWKFVSNVPQELDTQGFFRDYYGSSLLGDIYQASVQALGEKTYLFVSGFYLADVYELTGAAGTTTPPGTEICGNNLDDDGDGQIDEGCATLPPPPPSSTSCTATLTFDKTSVEFGGSMTEIWAVNGADVGQVFGDCGAGATPISYGSQSYTFNNLTKTMTCRVYGKINGAEACSASATIVVASAPSTPSTPPSDTYVDYTQTFAGGTQENFSVSTNTGSYNLGSATLRQGSAGSAVAQLQAFLNDSTNSGLVTDGKMGPKTTAAVKSWQASNGLVADGVVGPKTKARMAELY